MNLQTQENHNLCIEELGIKHRFRDLLPHLTDEQKSELYESVKEVGVNVPLVAWFDGESWWLVDGHNRHTAWMTAYQHNPSLPEPVIWELKAGTEDDVCAWIIQTHIGRRNLTPNQLSELRGRLYNSTKQKPGNPQFRQNDGIGKTSEKPGETSGKLSEQFGVSPRTIERDGDYAKGMEELEKADPDEAEKVRQGKSTAWTKADIERKGRGESEPGEPFSKETIKELCKPFNGWVRTLGEVREGFIGHAGQPGGDFIDDIAEQEIRTAIGRAQEIVKSRMPELHKPCKGEGCETCGNLGYVRKG